MTASRRAFALWGLRVYLRRLAEECSELAAVALRRAADESPELKGTLCAAVARVEISLEVLREQLGGLEIDRARAREIARLEKQLGAAIVKAGAISQREEAAAASDPLLTLAEAANELEGRRSPRALYQAVATGHLAVEREGRGIRVRRSVLMAYDKTARRRTDGGK